MTASPPLPFDIAVVGLGMKGIHQLTREGEETIRRCAQTFVADSSPGVVEYVSTISPKVVDLADRFRGGLHRAEIYRGIASEVVAAALEASPVCFATYGHPTVYSYPTALVQRAAAILDLRVSILPGISFLDALLVDLGVDPGFDGLQLYEATDLLARRRPLQPDVPCVIAQAPVVGDPTDTEPHANTNNIIRLQEYLLAFYPPDHPVVLVVSAPHPLLAPVRRKTELSNLASVVAAGPQSGTLYLPPVERRPIADTEFADRMRQLAD
jgi:uncharacterized protein YabN with tetrapyrrole methylase and pyrophosphatase domain